MPFTWIKPQQINYTMGYYVAYSLFTAQRVGAYISSAVGDQ